MTLFHPHPVMPTEILDTDRGALGVVETNNHDEQARIRLFNQSDSTGFDWGPHDSVLANARALNGGSCKAFGPSARFVKALLQDNHALYANEYYTAGGTFYAQGLSIGVTGLIRYAVLKSDMATGSLSVFSENDVHTKGVSQALDELGSFERLFGTTVALDTGTCDLSRLVKAPTRGQLDDLMLGLLGCTSAELALPRVMLSRNPCAPLAF